MKAALITGGSMGVGAALVKALTTRGTEVVNVDRIAGNGQTDHIACDLSSRNALDAALEKIVASGPYDLAILNAGINATGAFENIPSEAYARLVAVNLEAPMILASSLMRSGAVIPGGTIVFVSSLSYFTGYPGACVYDASKAALAVYASSVTKEFGAKGVHVLTVFPGPVATDHAERHAPQSARADERMNADVLALQILKAVDRRRHRLVPGLSNKFVALAGRIAPGAATRFMRRIIFERLDGPVY